MASVDDLVAKMRANPQGIRFAELEKVCRAYFGDPRRADGSHIVFTMPWSGDPRVNIQNDHGAAKAYQVRQVVDAIDKLAAEHIAQGIEKEERE